MRCYRVFGLDDDPDRDRPHFCHTLDEARAHLREEDEHFRARIRVQLLAMPDTVAERIRTLNGIDNATVLATWKGTARGGLKFLPEGQPETAL